MSTVNNQAFSYGQYPTSTNFKQRSSSTPALQAQQYQHPRVNRLRTSIPQPPLFNRTTTVPERRVHSTPNFPQGTLTQLSDYVTTLTQSGGMTSPFDNLSFGGGEFHPGDDMNLFDYDQDISNSFTSLNHGSDTQTVSPQDILMSAPGSAQSGFLDTPDTGFLDSPALGSSVYNTTPLPDADGDLDFDSLKNLQPLFQQPLAGYSYVPAGSEVGHSPALSYAQTTTSGASPMVRQKSSPGRPPIPTSIHARKRSLVSGVSKPVKPRKHNVNTEPELHDSKDEAKRKKNTEAARKSRQRKAEDMEYLQSEVTRLRTMVEAMGGNPDPSGDDTRHTVQWDD